MPTVTETSDAALLEVLQTRGPSTVAELASAKEVTATAIRQRLVRLIAQGLVQRQVRRTSQPGRPVHLYAVTEKARRRIGTNFTDLALVLWNVLKSVPNPDVRRGMLQRIAEQFGQRYAATMTGATPNERLQALVRLFEDRSVAISVDKNGNGLPILRVHQCPYPELAEQDRGICAVEKMMFTNLVGQPVRLTECRLEGHASCQFEMS